MADTPKSANTTWRAASWQPVEPAPVRIVNEPRRERPRRLRFDRRIASALRFF